MNWDEICQHILGMQIGKKETIAYFDCASEGRIKEDIEAKTGCVLTLKKVEGGVEVKKLADPAIKS